MQCVQETRVVIGYVFAPNVELRGPDVDDSWVKLQHASYKITVLVMLKMMQTLLILMQLFRVSTGFQNNQFES